LPTSSGPAGAEKPSFEPKADPSAPPEMDMDLDEEPEEPYPALDEEGVIG